MHYQLFIPHAQGQSPQMLVDIGLADLCQGAEYFPMTRNGPDDLPGVIVAWRKGDDYSHPNRARIGHHPTQQTWIPALPRAEQPAGRYYLGLWNDAPVQPADIARPWQVPGVHFTLGDDRQWLLPEAKELPHDLVRDRNGGWELCLQQKYHAFGIESNRLRRYFATNPSTWNLGECADFVEAALRLNYRLLPELASNWRLFNTANTLRACFSIWSLTDVLRDTAA